MCLVWRENVPNYCAGAGAIQKNTYCLIRRGGGNIVEADPRCSAQSTQLYQSVSDRAESTFVFKNRAFATYGRYKPNVF
ncbi:UNVERIFIED_ORG: hypothetical protein GGE53_003519 [Rhizobium etli]